MKPPEKHLLNLMGTQNALGLRTAIRLVNEVSQGKYLSAELHPHGFVSIQVITTKTIWVDVNLWPNPPGCWTDQTHLKNGCRTHRGTLHSWVVAGALRHQWGTTKKSPESNLELIKLHPDGPRKGGQIEICWQKERTLTAPTWYTVAAHELHEAEPLTPTITVATWSSPTKTAELVMERGKPLPEIAVRDKAPPDLIEKLLQTAWPQN